jgi:hypothetical protein
VPPSPHNQLWRLTTDTSVCLPVCLSACALAHSHALHCLSPPHQPSPPPLSTNSWSHALNRTQALHRPVTDYDSISGTNSFYVTCPMVHFEFIPSMQYKLQSTICFICYTSPGTFVVSLFLVYSRKWKLLALRFILRKTCNFTKTMINGRVSLNAHLCLFTTNAYNKLFPYTSNTLYSHTRESIVRSYLLQTVGKSKLPPSNVQREEYILFLENVLYGQLHRYNQTYLHTILNCYEYNS